MQWVIFAMVIAGVIVGTALYVVDRRAERELRREELAIERKKADTAAQNAQTAAQRAENTRYQLATERSEMELKFSRDDRLKSATLDEEHRRMNADGKAADLAAAGVDSV